jgi:hypothetical protein
MALSHDARVVRGLESRRTMSAEVTDGYAFEPAKC